MKHFGLLATCLCFTALAAAPQVPAAPLVPAAGHMAVVPATTHVAVAAAGATPSHAQSAPPTLWATWITRNIEVNLQNLPKTYSCDELWYKVRGVLLALGARDYLSVAPYGCGPGAANGGRSPTLQIRFQTLRVLTGANIKWAETKAVRKTVRLGPGSPKKLDAGDCALLSQLNGTLIAYLHLPVVATDLQCSNPRSARRYSVSVKTIIAQPATSSHA